MSNKNERWDGASVGFLLLLTLAVASYVLLVVGEVGGAASWRTAVFLPLAALLVTVYALITFRDHRRLQQELRGSEQQRKEVEGGLVGALEDLRVGDLVSMGRRAKNLPASVGAAFKNAGDAINSLAQQIQASSTEVATAASSVNQIASELASGSSEQAASVVEITAAMEELARTAAQIAENATAQARLTAEAEASGAIGSDAVDEAVGGVEEVKKRIAGIASRADTLGTRSKEIYRVLDLITDIAQETHILSLNAAIEAAAAGDHGRRFSVVAEEVRRLAQRSQESVDSVRNLLDEFTSSIRATVVATEEGSKEAGRVLERTRAAAAAIDELKSSSVDTARVAREISLATQQQNAASDQVVLTLKEVSQVVQRMADSLKQFTGTADRLNHLGLGIQLVAQSYHLDSPHSLKHVAEDWAEEIRQRLGSWEAIELVLEDMAQRRPFLECVYFFDERGGQNALVVNHQLVGPIDVRPSVRSGEGFSERPWYRAAVLDGRAVVTPLFSSLLTGQSIFTAACPVYDGGQLRGVLGLDINADSWAKI
jgi:methyl-accepting chemotaxis protein